MLPSLSLTLALSLAVSQPRALNNLAPNPSFEEADADGVSPKGWHPWGGNNPPENVRLDPTQPHSGRSCLRVTDPSTTANWYAASDYIAIDPAQRYYVAVWAHAEGDRQGVMRFDMLDGQKGYLTSRTVPVRAGRDWRRTTLAVLDVDSRARLAQVSLVATTQDTAETGMMWFDDVELVALTPDGALEPGGPPIVKRLVAEPDPNTWFAFPIPLLDPAGGSGAPGLPSALDSGDLVSGPTGNRGFLKVGPDGHFHWENGERARFWGTNIHASDACFPSHEQAESFARRMKRQGVNLIRTHLLEYESPGGLIARGDTSRRLDPAQLERFDYLLYQFHLNGIYILCDALPMCARKLKAADGDPDFAQFPLGAPGASQFDETVIGLEQEYARQYLLHENPYTKKRLVDDPTLALLEMTNEDSLFLIGRWGKLPPPYAAKLNRRWNEWLRAKYQTREALRTAWTDPAGDCALADNEDPAAGTVRGGFLPYPSGWSRKNLGDDAPARVNDECRFLYDLQRGYYQTQVAFLRGLGVRAPITGSNISSDEALLKASDVLDFTDNHQYWDSPQYEGGNESSLDNDPQVRADLTRVNGLINGLSVGKVAGKPFVATEWNSLWPNEYRSADVLSTAAYACLQDWDATFIYCYLGGWGIGFDDAQPKIPHATVIYADPAQAGLFPAASRLFLRHDVAAARNVFEVGYSDMDTFFPQYYGLQPRGPLQVMPYVSRVQKAFFDERYEPSPDATVTAASGCSARGDYRRAKRLILATGNPYTSADLQVMDGLAPTRKVAPTVGFADTRVPTMVFENPGDRLQPVLKFPAPDGISVLAQSDMPPGAVPVPPRAEDAYIGVLTRDRALVPSLFRFLGAIPDLYARVATQALRHWGLMSGTQGYLPEEHAVRSDTGELTSEWATGSFRIGTKRTAGAAGFLGALGEIREGDVSFKCRTDFATIVVTSLDGQSIDISDRLLLTAVGRAANTGQKLEVTAVVGEDGRPTPQSRTKVAALGGAPVLAEPVLAEVTLHRAASGARLRCFALDPGGKRLAEVPLTPVGDGVMLSTDGKYRTIYYELATK